MAISNAVAGVIVGCAIAIALGLGLGLGLQSSEPESTTVAPRDPQTYCQDVLPHCETCSFSDQYKNEATLTCSTCDSDYYKLNGCYRTCNQTYFDDTTSYDNWVITCEADPKTVECKFTTVNGTCYEFGRVYNLVTGTMSFKLKNLITFSSDAFLGSDARSVTRLEISENQIVELPEYSFRNMANLEQLILYGNNITIIPDHAFDGLKKLRELYLYNNMITTFNAEAWMATPALAGLFLYQNQLEILQPNVFDGLGNMVYLYLNQNSLNGSLPDGLFDFGSKIKGLSLDENKLTYVDSSLFKNLYDIQLLDLSYNLCQYDPWQCSWQKSNYDKLSTCHCEMMTTTTAPVNASIIDASPV